VVLYQVTVSDFRRPLAPGWERQVADAVLCEDIAACADLDPTHRLPDARTLAERLRSLDERRRARADTGTTQSPANEKTSSLVSPARRKWLLAGGAVAGMAMMSASLLWHRRRSATNSTIPRIAVLPFNDASVGGIEGALADGLAADVIGRLERESQVRVLSRDSSFKLQMSSDDRSKLPQVKSQLDADYALLGDVYRHHDRIRVTVRLISVAADEDVWRDAFEQPADSIGALPAMIAKSALEALDVANSVVVSDASSQAYELYVLGEHAYESRTAEAIRRARDYYQRAIDLDPGYARAYAGVAKTWLAEADYGFGLSWREAAARAQPLLDKAFILQKDLFEALVIQGVLSIQLMQYEYARSFLERAVALYPNSALAHFTLGVSYDFDTLVKQALGHYAYALELDPLNTLVDRRMAMSLMWTGQYDAALKHFRRTVELIPKGASGYWGLGSLGYARGRYDDAVRAYREALGTDSRHPNVWNELAWLYMDLGMRDEAQTALENQRQLSKSTQEPAMDSAWQLLLRNQPEAARSLLTRHGLLESSEPTIAVDAMVLACIAGQPVDLAAVDRSLQQMRADPVPWVGSYDLFLGHCVWLQIATLYLLGNRPDRAAPLLEDTESFIRRIKQNGNIYHTVPYFEARICALRGQPEQALEHLSAAIERGWRRGWWIRWDPAFRLLRSDGRLNALLARIDTDMTLQRERLEKIAAPTSR
jgi:TolB-like protein/Flp pilus assembly protein TadD